MDKKHHWEGVYSEKALTDVSWYQSAPTISWQMMQEFKIAKDSAIIDVGGGDSLFVDFLLSNGFSNITVLDISEHAIERAKARLGADASKVTWVVSDILNFSTDKKFDLWHDRAVLHFLTAQNDIKKYVDISRRHLKNKGKLIISTFSENGPEKCSGLAVTRYSEISLSEVFSRAFEKIKCLTESHKTPWGKIQDFLYCAFSNGELSRLYS